MIITSEITHNQKVHQAERKDRGTTRNPSIKHQTEFIETILCCKNEL